jgi:hypothetical protein
MAVASSDVAVAPSWLDSPAQLTCPTAFTHPALPCPALPSLPFLPLRYHLGTLKAKLAKLRTQLQEPPKVRRVPTQCSPTVLGLVACIAAAKITVGARDGWLALPP